MKLIALGSALCIALTGCMAATEIVPEADVTPAAVDRSAVTPIAIDRVVLQVPRGQQIGVVKMGLLCIPHIAITIGSGQAAVTDASYLDAIQHEFVVIDYPITTSPTELFPTGAAEATRIRLAGRIVDVKSNVCFPMAGFGDLSNGTADASVRVEWQAYDSATKSIIFKTMTTGTGSIKKTVSNPGALANDMAAGMATRRFLVSPEFQGLERVRMTSLPPHPRTSP